MTSASIARDPDLSILSLQIANEIDKVNSKQHADPILIANFKEKLSTRAGIENIAGRLSLSADPFTIGILGRAVRAVRGDRITQVDQLIQVLQDLISRLTPTEFREGSEDLLALKQFCLSLHEAITAAKASPALGESARGNEPRLR